MAKGGHGKKLPWKNVMAPMARSWPRAQGPAQGHRAALKGFLPEGHGRFCHGHHDIFPRQLFAMVAFFAMAAMAFVHAQSAKLAKWPD